MNEASNSPERIELISRFWDALRVDDREGMTACLEIDATLVNEPNKGGFSPFGHAVWDVSEETAVWFGVQT